MTDGNDVTATPYAEFLEGSLQAIVALAPDNIGIVAVRESDGMAVTAYYHTDADNKAVLLHHVLSDYIMDIVENNARNIRNMLADLDDDDEEDGDEIE